MATAQGEKARALHLNQMTAQGHGESLSILKADFGHWPPRGLDIVNAPAQAVAIKKYTDLFTFTKAYVSNKETAPNIYINRAMSLLACFNRAAKDRANTLSHEHIHILQKAQMRKGLSDPFGRNRRHNLQAFIKPSAPSYNQYLCDEDETQVRLHQLVAAHYRSTRRLPLNMPELYALLETEGVRTGSAFVTRLLSGQTGMAAKARFTVRSPRSSLAGSVSDLNTIFQTITPQKRDEYCRTILPAIYGQLLELYGDRQGCRRMGYHHNLSLTEVFFRQAWGLHYQQTQSPTPPNTSQIEQTILMMPPSQAGDLMQSLQGGEGSYIHPVTQRAMQLDRATMALITPFISRHNGQAAPV